MIALLRGTVADRRPDQVVLDVHGVGYRVLGPQPALAALPDDKPVTLHICTVVREDAITLYGFPSAGARDTFQTLREVNGVGPRLAMAVLSTLSPGQLTAAVETDDVRVLLAISGVGKKLASRLCLELKGKLSVQFEPGDVGATATARPSRSSDPLALALAQLDYRKTDIDRAMDDDRVPDRDDAPIEDRLRAALRVLSGSR
ncbi:MAG: Holliday junction branch migration protein RuvA [Oligoflexia bacterium]|nr:Holliday junction branch migration protein RuvA [Oligoflexia bacterium]